MQQGARLLGEAGVAICSPTAHLHVRDLVLHLLRLVLVLHAKRFVIDLLVMCIGGLLGHPGRHVWRLWLGSEYVSEASPVDSATAWVGYLRERQWLARKRAQRGEAE